MAELQIKPGTKLKVAFDTAVGQKTEFNMMATFKGVIDEAYFLISAPMLAGKPLILDENQKFLLQYTLGENTFMLAGYPESVEKAGIRTYWKMRQVAEHRTFFKRRDERFKVSMRLRYLRDEASEDEWKEANAQAVVLQEKAESDLAAARAETQAAKSDADTRIAAAMREAERRLAAVRDESEAKIQMVKNEAEEKKQAVEENAKAQVEAANASAEHMRQVADAELAELRQQMDAAANAHKEAASKAEQRHVDELAQLKQEFEQRIGQLNARLEQSERARVRAEKRAEGNRFSNYLLARLRGEAVPVASGNDDSINSEPITQNIQGGKVVQDASTGQDYGSDSDGSHNAVVEQRGSVGETDVDSGESKVASRASSEVSSKGGCG